MTAKRNLDHEAVELFGEELRRARLRAGLSQDQLGDEIGYSGSLVGMVETGQRPPSLDFAQRCEKLLKTDGLLLRLYKFASREFYEDWFQDWVDVEQAATELRWWEPMLVPGLLQTRDYARAIFRAARPKDTDEQIEQQVDARMERQSVLAKDDAPFLWAMMDEDVLLRPVGDAKAMREQLAHMLELAKNPRIRILVVPHAVGAHAGLTGAFIIASVEGTPDTVYLETAARGQITDTPEVVKTCAFAFDTLRAEALSPKASIDLIAKVMKEIWT
jgi:transcriptional regulator with XRE-family HTH domain